MNMNIRTLYFYLSVLGIVLPYALVPNKALQPMSPLTHGAASELGYC